MKPQKHLLIDNLLAMDHKLLTDDDYFVLDLLKKTHNSFGGGARKILNRSCCWDITLEIASYPKAGEHLYNSKAKTFAQANCDIAELTYFHEGTLELTGAVVVAAKIFQQYLDPETMVVYARAVLRPMELSTRIKRHGPFKSVVSFDDDVNINYFCNPLIPENYSLITNPLTGAM